MCFTAFLIFISLLFSSTVWAQEDGPYLIHQGDESPSTLLWEVSGNDLEEPSYVFGTIHLICSEYVAEDERVSSALDQAELLALELDMTDETQMSQVQQLSMNEGGHNISSDLKDSVVEKIDELIQPQMGMGMSQAGVMKPFVIQSMIMMAEMENTCDEGISSYEDILLESAQQQDMEVAGLETAEFQIGLFDDIPMDEQLDQLETMATEDNYVTDQFDELFDLYLHENIQGLYKLFEEDEMWVQYKDGLLDTRNQAWISDMKELMDEQPVFFGVGAGHLPGEQGVLQLLKDEGYSVEPVH